jgi:hypothetical protein
MRIGGDRPQPGGRGYLQEIGNQECLGGLERLRGIGLRSDGIREIRVEESA